jgi:hypothetical protein
MNLRAATLAIPSYPPEEMIPLSILHSMYNHYRNLGLCRVPDALSSAFCRALDKNGFAESRTRRIPALGNELVYRVQDTRHMRTLGKDMFAECQTLGKGGARQRVVSGRHKAEGR